MLVVCHRKQVSLILKFLHADSQDKFDRTTFAAAANKFFGVMSLSVSELCLYFKMFYLNKFHERKHEQLW